VLIAGKESFRGNGCQPMNSRYHSVWMHGVFVDLDSPLSEASRLLSMQTGA
jgi:hypothetical protein